ncbi:MAG TPA: hypothetical protein VK425_02320, partial [Acidimicrobiales bacterium]|nr:hypothetical protein [Acidimicrobiales bacterium]
MFNKRQITKALVALAAVAAGAPLVGAGAAVVDIWPAAASPSICTGTIAGVSAYAGGGQVAKVGEAFTSALEAQVVDTGGCPVANVNVDFVAPATGASGTFPGAATTVSVPTGSNGIATAPQLTANSASGSFSVTASVSGPTGTTYSTAFQLTNTTLGAVSTVRASSGNNQSAHIGSTFSSPLSVTVADSYGDPVTGTTVIFTVVTNNGAGASFAGGGASVSEQTSSYGVATSPALTAGDTVGTFTVTATVTGTTEMATFTLTDLAGAPNAITAGVGSSQSTQLGADFTVPLAVTVTDSDGNAVAGARVVFSAPASGPSGVFAGAGRTAIAITNSDGVATAPDFSANQD